MCGQNEWEGYPDKMIDFERFTKIITEAKELGVDTIELTGGEP